MQYVQKYSAAFWGTSFVREMGKITVDTDKGEPVQEAVKENGIPNGQVHAS